MIIMLFISNHPEADAKSRNSIWKGRIFLLPVLLLWSIFSTDLYAAELEAINFATSPELTRVVLQLSEKIRFSAHRLPAAGHEPDRCYVDLYSTRRGHSLPQRLNVDSGNIMNIRTGTHGTMLRVVLDLKNSSDCSIQSDPQNNRIILDATVLPATLDNLPAAGQPFQENPLTEPLPKVLHRKIPPQETQLEPSPIQDQRQTAVELQPTAELPQPALPENLAGFTTQPQSPFSGWGWVQGFAARDIRDDPAEDDHLTRLRARLGIGWDGGLEHDRSLLARASIDLDYLSYANDFAKDETDINMHESYLQLNAPNWDLSVGKQRVRWGKSDQLTPLDNINPEDFRQFLTIDLEERKIPSWLVRLRWYGPRMNIETILSPWFEESELEYFDSDWALYRNLRQAIVENPSLPSEIKSYAEALRVHEQQPGDSFENMSAALRLTWQTDQSDFGVSYRYGWETLPTIISFPVKNIRSSGDPQEDPAQLLSGAILTGEQVEARFKRQQVIGFEWESVFEQIGFRGELAYLNKVALLSSDLTSQRKAAGHLVTGIDYTSETEWYFNLQTSWYRIFDFTKDILYLEQDNISLLGEIRKPVWRGNLEFSVKYILTVTDQSSLLQPATTLKYFPNTECEFGAMIFSGDGDTLLGSYDQADQLYARIKVSF
jgi:hypothetical protein